MATLKDPGTSLDSLLDHRFQFDGRRLVITVPTRVASSAGSPQVYSADLATSREVNSSRMSSWISSRFTAVQRWPEFR